MAPMAPSLRPGPNTLGTGDGRIVNSDLSKGVFKVFTVEDMTYLSFPGRM